MAENGHVRRYMFPGRSRGSYELFRYLLERSKESSFHRDVLLSQPWSIFFTHLLHGILRRKAWERLPPAEILPKIINLANEGDIICQRFLAHRAAQLLSHPESPDIL